MAVGYSGNDRNSTLPAFGAEQRRQPLGLCLFSALIQAFEGQHVSCIDLRSGHATRVN